MEPPPFGNRSFDPMRWLDGPREASVECPGRMAGRVTARGPERLPDECVVHDPPAPSAGGAAGEARAPGSLVPRRPHRPRPAGRRPDPGVPPGAGAGPPRHRGRVGDPELPGRRPGRRPRRRRPGHRVQLRSGPRGPPQGDRPGPGAAPRAVRHAPDGPGNPRPDRGPRRRPLQDHPDRRRPGPGAPRRGGVRAGSEPAARGDRHPADPAPLRIGGRAGPGAAAADQPGGGGVRAP